MGDAKLSEAEERILAVLKMLGAGTVSDVALETRSPASEVADCLERLEDDGKLKARPRHGFETKIYSLNRRRRG